MCLHKEYIHPENNSRFYRRGNRRLIDDTVSIPDSIRQACKSSNVPLLYYSYKSATVEADRLGRDVLKIYMNIISLPAFRGMTYEDSDI